MSNKIEAQERNLASVFSDAYEFEIPPYQRPYAWEEDQARELLSDVLDALDDQERNEGLYFLGSIVLVKHPGEPSAKVIDGQQRLTTLTILLSVLRDLTSDQEARFKRCAYIYQKADADRGLTERYRLLLREQDRPFFLKYVQTSGATDQLADVQKLEGSQRCIAQNTVLFRSRLQAMPEERRNELMAFLLQRCYLVVVAVATTEVARRIFTVLNARGLDLMPTDILKADLLERCANEDKQEAALAERWEQVERSVGRDGLAELFGHIRAIWERDKPRLALEVGFKKFVVPFTQDADKFVSDVLEPAADAFLMLSDAARIQKRYGSEAAKVVRSLSRIDSKDWVPPALLYLWKSGPEETSEVSKFLVELERVAYFLFVTRAGVNERISRFASIIEGIDPRRGDPADDAGLDLTAAEQYAFVRALGGSLYAMTRVCKPVLQRLDEALSSGGASYDELVSIEHVLPQTVTEGSEWARLFPDEATRSEWTHRLGNLVFLTHRINTRASNWEFSRKKREYFCSADGSSPFVITQGVLQVDSWTPEHLENRQSDLLLKLCEVWRLDEAYVEEQPDLAVRKERGIWKFTAGEVLDAKREKMLTALAARDDVTLIRKGARCWTENNDYRAILTVSKRYLNRSAPYWYVYSDRWHEFLRGVEDSFMVFGCVDRTTAYAVPASEMQRHADELNRTPGRHWHVFLEDAEDGSLELILRSGKRISLKEFELVLD